MSFQIPHAARKSVVDTVSSKEQNNFWFFLKMLQHLFSTLQDYVFPDCL